MTSAPDAAQPTPSGMPTQCARGDGRPVLAIIHDVGYCGPCAIEAVKQRAVPEVS